MKKRIPKRDKHGSKITCDLCFGDGCTYCEYSGVELTDNPDYWDKKISDEEDRRAF